MAGSERGAACAGTGGLSSFALKAVAIVGMTANHAGYLFANELPFWASCVLIGLGGLTFPVMAFLLVEGYRRTSNVKRYAFRLGAFALVSQIPYGLFLDDNINVLFTLLIGLGVLYADEHVRSRGAFWAVTAAGALASLACDWGFVGVVVIVLFKKLGAGRACAGAIRPGGLGTRCSSPARPPPARCRFLPRDLPDCRRRGARLAAHAARRPLPHRFCWLPWPRAFPCSASLRAPLRQAATGRCSPSSSTRSLAVLQPSRCSTLTADGAAFPRNGFFYAYYPAHIAVLGMVHLLVFG